MTEGADPDTDQVQVPGEGSQDQGSLQPSGGDPLDELKAKGDIDGILGEAKKYRSIAQRRDPKKDPAPASQPAAVQPAADVVTKQDLNRINTQSARDLVDADVQKNWDALIEYVPFKYRSAETPKDIAKGMQLAFEAWQKDNPQPVDPAAPLQTTPVTKASAKPEHSEGRKTEPLIRKSEGMKNWFPKQS